MSKYLSLMLAVIITLNVIYSFVVNAKTEAVFGFEINVWVYRIVWSILAILLYRLFFKTIKEVN